MKVKTTTARRRFVEQLLAPQLQTMFHKRTGKRLVLVGIPQFGKEGAYLQQCYAEAFLDLLESNDLIVVQRPTPEQLADQGIELDLEPKDLHPGDPLPEPRTYRRIRPGETPETWQPGDPEYDIEKIAPALIAKTPPGDDAAANLNRGARPSDAAREAFDRANRRDRATRAIRTILPPFLRKLQCAVMVIDDAETTPDHRPTKITLHIDLPADTTGAPK